VFFDVIFQCFQTVNLVRPRIGPAIDEFAQNTLTVEDLAVKSFYDTEIPQSMMTDPLIESLEQLNIPLAVYSCTGPTRHSAWPGR
jgi:hypothetical protein